MTFRKDINGLRAVAVLLVLLFHFGAPGLGAGFIGVDIFFVISGFLMTGIIVSGLEKRRFSILGFYRARVARLYPALLAVVAATLLFGMVFVEPGALEEIARDGIAALLFVSNFVFLKEAGYFGAPADAMWLLHTWSLSVEWQFYLIYPIVLAVAFPFLPSRMSRFLLVAAGFVLSLALSALMASFDDKARIISADFYMLPPRAWEMLAGGLVVLWPWRAPAWARERAALLEIAGLLLILLSLPLFSPVTPWPSYVALLPVAGTMLVLAANAPRSVLSAAPLQFLGAWSYSIYLWHWPLVAAIAYFGFAGPLVAPAAFAASLLAGWASYRFIEQPCRTLLKETPGKPHRTRIALMAGLGCSTLAVSAAGAVTMLDRGIPQRNEAVAAIYQESLDASADYRFPLSRCGGTTTFRKARPCELGTPSQNSDVLVIGDSFAQMWYARVAELEPHLTDHAVVFITQGGCPPISGLEREAPGFGCSSFHRLEMEQAMSERYGTVIFAGMWASYFEKAQSNSTLCDRNGACGISASTEAGLDAAIDSLARDVDILRANGKTVVVLTTSPYPAFNVPKEWRRRLFAGDAPPADWSFDFNAIVTRSQPIDAGLKKLEAHGAAVIDLAGLLCRDMICPAAREAVPLYTDASHLRSNYAAVVGTFLDPFIR